MNAEAPERGEQTGAAPWAPSSEHVVIRDRVQNDAGDKRDPENVARDGCAEDDSDAGKRSGSAVECGATQVLVQVVAKLHERRRGLTSHKISCGGEGAASLALETSKPSQTLIAKLTAVSCIAWLDKIALVNNMSSADDLLH